MRLSQTGATYYGETVAPGVQIERAKSSQPTWRAGVCRDASATAAGRLRIQEGCAEKDRTGEKDGEKLAASGKLRCDESRNDRDVVAHDWLQRILRARSARWHAEGDQPGQRPPRT